MRKGRAKKRIVMPDPRYNDTIVAKFVNYLMQDGKKNLAYTIFYNALDKVAEQTEEDGFEIWKKALSNVCPLVEVKRKRVGGATFQVPIEVRTDRKIYLGIKWLIVYARKRKEPSMIERLSKEIIDASKGTGLSVKKKDDIHKMAESNKAFSHYNF